MVARFTENTQRLQPQTRERLQPAKFGGEEIGESVARAGGAIVQFAQDQDKINAIYDAAAAKKADAESLREIAVLKGTALAATGFDAQAAVTQAQKRFDEIRRERMESLPTPRAQSMFNEAFEARTARDLADLSTHATKQTLAAHRDASIARVGAYQEEAIASYNNPEAFAAARDTAFGEIETIFSGAGPDVIRQKKQEWLSSTHVAVIDQLMTDPENTLEAKAWVDTHADEITALDETKIRQKMQPQLEEARTDADVGMIMEEVLGGADEDAPAPTEQRAETADATSYHPLRGVGRVSTTPTAHQARGGGTGRLAIDYAAPAGTPIVSPPMSGRVVEKGFKPEGNGHYIKIEHPDGKISTYLHMRSASPFEEGDVIEANSTIGSVGSTGKSTGNHLDFSVSDADGRALDPTKVSWQEGDLPEFTPERNDKAQLYAAAHRVATRENWSRRRYDAALKEIDTMVAREDNLRARAKEDIADQVWERIVELGDDFTRLDQIPNFADLDPKEKVTVINRMEQNQKGTEPEAYGEDYMDLLEMATDPAMQEEFATIDLRRVNGITKGERASLMRSQGSIRGREGKAGANAASFSRIGTAITRYAPEAQIDTKAAKKEGTEDRRRLTKLRERAVARVQARQEQLGRELTDAEIDGIVRGEVVATTVTTRNEGLLWSTDSKKVVPRYLADEVEGATSYVAIPVAERNAIIEAYKRRNNGAVPPETEISRLYLSGLGR